MTKPWLHLVKIDVTTPLWRSVRMTFTFLKWGLRARLQGSKHLALKFSLYRWKGLEVWMLKMASHEPIEHLQHKLCTKEKPRVKLAVWLPTTKIWESTWPRCVRIKCNTPLENFQGALQVCFKPHPNRRSKQGVMSCQSPESPNRDSFGTPPWESREKNAIWM
jgi:hypothetical protein